MKALRFIVTVFRDYPRLLAINVMVVLAVGVADVLALVSLAPVVDYVLDPTLAQTSDLTNKVTAAFELLGVPVTLATLMLAFIGFNALRNGIYLAATYVMLRTKYSLSRRLIVGTFSDFFNARWTFFSSRDQGVFLNTFSREMTTVSDALGAMTYLLTYVIEVALYLVVPYLISWQVASASIVTAVVLGLPFLGLTRVSYRWGQANTSTANAYMSSVAESLASAKVVLGFGNQRKSTARVAGAFDAHRRVSLRSQTLNAGVPLAYYPIGLTVMAVALFIARETSVPLSSTTVILYSFLKIIPLIGQMIGQKSTVENALPSYEQIERLRQDAGAERVTSGDREYVRFERDLALADVSFAYPGGPPTLESVDLVVPKGEMVALIGPSGAGKTTVVDLLMGLIEPTAGAVLVDGLPLSEYESIGYRQRVGYVPQDPILFNATIRENMLWSSDAADESDIAEALAKAHADEFVSQLPEGLDTVVGDRGVRLSGGQVQRLALARALVRRPDLLILDEATSSLDSESERLIQDAIDSIAGEITVVAVAHRLSTVRNADRVYVLESGRVVEEGAFSELAARPDSYVHTMGKLQGIGG